MNNLPRTILITGAGSGLGRGLAQCLAAEGHLILATDLSLTAASETASLVQAAGGTAEAFALNVTDEAAIQKLMGELSHRQIDVLINNAGLQYVSKVEEFPIEKWDQLINVILNGTFLMTKAVLPGMRERGFGRLIHIGSIHSSVASPFKSAYVAAKHALIGFSKTIALETAGVDITSNTICPAYIRTPLVDAQIQNQARTRGVPEADIIEKVMLEPMPKKCFITIEEVAATAEFLMQPLAKNITGQAITIDGGWTAQ
ncbi:3-hydroxybutyrate dehydrogenase [Planctomicrobium sp. SH527]|uniref:3-hydroxybutyrate dehydrogenase n=1 Tax=Planctomicrobium sp. SH527 TaxID=3448123 RepID=UPI003F5B6311